MGKPSIVEINGKRYDAFSGQRISGAKKAKRQLIKPFSIDGFTPQLEPVIIPKVEPAAKSPKHSAAIKRHRKASAQAVHQRTQKSKTLIRKAVARTHHAHKFHQQVPAIARTGRIERLSRATSVKKSTKVKRFGLPTHRLNVVSEIMPRKARLPAPLSRGTAAIQAAPSVIRANSSQQLERLLDAALARADAHKQRLKGRPSSKRRSKFNWLIISLLALALLIVGLYFAWQKIPAVSMKIASSKAGIAASIPKYTPDGFTFSGPVKYQNNAVQIHYTANDQTSHDFTITQSASNLDSVSLKDTAIPANSQVQTSQVKGTTVYIYGSQNNATWVNNGIRYTLQDNANLNSDQVLKIVDSL